MLAPLPLGSNREWSWTLCAFIVAVITLAWALQSLRHPQQVSTSITPPVIILFLAVCLWAWLQTVGWIPAGWKHPLWGLNAEVLAQQLPGSISLAAEDSLTAVMRLLCYGLVFFLAFQFGRDRPACLELISEGFDIFTKPLRYDLPCFIIVIGLITDTLAGVQVG